MSQDTRSSDFNFFRNFSVVMIGLALAEVVFFLVVNLSMPHASFKSHQFLMAAPVQSASQLSPATESSAPAPHRGHGQERG